MTRLIFSVDDKIQAQIESRGISYMVFLDAVLNKIVEQHGLQAKTISVDIEQM